MKRSTEWTQESEQAALARLQSAHPLVLIYVRQSKSDFNSDGSIRGVSLDQQEVDARRIAAITGCPVEVFRDADRSGKESDRRPGYRAMMERIDSAMPGAIGAVACYDQSRIWRNAGNFHLLMADMEKRGILVFEQSGLIRSDDGWGWGVKALAHHMQRKEIVKRTKASLRRLQEKGRALGRAEFGYRIVETPDGHDKVLALDSGLAQIIREADPFGLYATGKYSHQSLEVFLNAHHLPGLSNGRWKMAQLKGMLHNPAYVGLVETLDAKSGPVLFTRLVRLPNRSGWVEQNWVKGSHEALVDMETFEKCQRVRDEHREHGRKTYTTRRVAGYALTGLIHCAQCGGRMQGQQRRMAVGKPDEHDLVYYRCGNNYTAVRCGSPWIRGDEVEAELRMSLSHALHLGEIDPEQMKQMEAGWRKAPDPRKELKAQIAAKDRQVENIRKAAEAGLIDDAQKAMDSIAKLNEEKQALRAQLELAPEVAIERAQAEVGNLVRRWDGSDAGTKGQMLRTIFDRLEAGTAADGRVSVVCVPRPGWRGFFQRVTVDRRFQKEQAAVEASLRAEYEAGPRVEASAQRA
jgi:DNA invertase Pin-like site-specific DNA recombinase